MEFELVEQMSWSPSTTYLPVKIKYEKEIAPVCEAQIICKKHANCEDFADMFESALKSVGFWDLSSKKPRELPSRVVQKYKLELTLGEEYFCLPSERSKISPLYPLATFPEKISQQ
jgi:hypothetical protein